MQNSRLYLRTLACCTTVLLPLLVACGGATSSSNNSAPPATIGVTLNQSTVSSGGGATQSFTASVANNSANAGVNWTISGSGSLSAASSASAPFTTTYSAPAIVSADATVTLTATSKTDPTKSASATISLVPIVITLNPSAARLSPGGSQGFTVSVANDLSNSGVSWGIGSGAGSLSGLSANGATYTAPSVLSGTLPSFVTLTAASVKDPTQTATENLLLTPSNAPLSQWVYYNSSGNLAYKQLDSQGDQIMDFSTAGYNQGAGSIPTVPVALTVSPSGGDDTANIQSAINDVSSMPINPSTGFRGAVLLQPGSYTVSSTLTISTSGVVLRGSGDGASPISNTVITMTAASTPYPLVIMGSSTAEPISSGSATAITDAYVPAGTTTLDVASTAGLAVGETVMVRRPATTAWVAFMGMTAADLGTNCSSGPCSWTDIGPEHFQTDRTITAVSGNKITLDVPISDSIDSTYLGIDGGSVEAYTYPGRISQVGIEDFYVVAPAPPNNLVPPTPSYQIVMTYAVINGWARNLTGLDTLESVDIETSGKQITVSNVSITHTVTQTDGAKFEDFYVNSSTQVLFDTVSDIANNIVYFGTSSNTQGPNVIRNATFQGNGLVEPHQRWATGLLVENTTVSSGGVIDLIDRGSDGSGQGWAIGWGVIWNASANTFTIQQPPGSQNWCIGCTGTQLTTAPPYGPTVQPGGAVLPEGAVDSPGIYVYPASLYQAQLNQRLGASAVAQ